MEMFAHDYFFTLKFYLKEFDLHVSLHICGVTYIQECLLQEHALPKDGKNLMPTSRRMIKKLYILSVGCHISTEI